MLYGTAVGTVDRKLPDNPLDFIRSCVRNERMVWTYHIGRRLEKRAIGRSAIVGSTETYEVVESYPDDKYLPSYLVLARPPGDAIHVLFATDVEGDNVRVVTAYRPSRDEWEDDLEARRAPR
jgi:hypothetical protein